MEAEEEQRVFPISSTFPYCSKHWEMYYQNVMVPIKEKHILNAVYLRKIAEV